MNRAAQVLSSRATVVVLWVLAVGIAGVLVYARYRSAIGDGVWFDFTHYFLPSGEAVRSGQSPYVVDGYVYSPMIAALVAVTLGFVQPIAVWTIFNLTAAVSVIALLTAAVWASLRPWQRPCFAAAAFATLMWNWLTTLMLSSGQTDLYVMVALGVASLAASRHSAVGAGAGVAIAALTKTWPIVVGLWFFRRGAFKRGITVISAVTTGLIAIIVFVMIWGPESITAWLAAVLDARNQPGLIHFNVQSMGNQLFGNGPGTDASIPMPWLATLVTIGGVMTMLGLLGVALWWPGDDVLSLWHVTFVLVLLLPVSHSVYLLLGLPILWIWFARFLRTPSRPSVFFTLAIWVVWWIVSARIQWSGDTFTTMSTLGYATVMLSSVAALAMSVAIEARSHTDARQPRRNAQSGR